ncbi:MAG: hypothetical protein IK095_06240 [Oscillospiraceae bacterium]|nr:hypothetical protein [Oscillospiraceae bacterium]
MLIHDDWFMRQVESIAAALARLLLGKEVSLRSDAPEVTAREQGDLLLSLIREGKICAAEDLLFEKAGPGEDAWLAAGLRMYRELALLPEKDLVRAGFSREEILQGLKDLCALYGHSELFDLVER